MELLDHYRAEGRGDPPSEMILAEESLIAALREAEAGLTARAELFPMGNGDSDIALVGVDEPAEARYSGAVEVLAEREHDLRQFVADNLTALAVERAPEAGAIRDRVAAAMVEARAAADSYERAKNGFVELLKLADRPQLIAEIPANPLRAVFDFEEAVVPLPESFT